VWGGAGSHQQLSRLLYGTVEHAAHIRTSPLLCGAGPWSRPDVPKTVNERPTGEIFLRVPQQPDETPIKTPFLACNSTILGLPLERSS
jgi:hypothetical protein